MCLVVNNAINVVHKWARHLITAPKRSLRRLYFYTCLSFCPRGGGVPGQVPPQQVHPPGRYTPLAGTPPAGTPPGRYTPRPVHPPAGTPPPRAGTPLWQVHPRQVHTPDRYTPWQVHPPGRYPTTQGAVHAGRYGQQAGGMHPTGMHSCLKF